MQSLIASVYRHVIDDVVSKVKPEFVQEGVDEDVLDELRVLWESKLSSIIDAEYPEEAVTRNETKSTPDKKVKGESKVDGYPVGTSASGQATGSGTPEVIEQPGPSHHAGDVTAPVAAHQQIQATQPVLSTEPGPPTKPALPTQPAMTAQAIMDPAQAAVAFLHSQTSLDAPNATQQPQGTVVTGQPVDQQWFQTAASPVVPGGLDPAAVGALLSNMSGLQYFANSPGLPYSFSGIASPALSGLGNLLGGDSFNMGLSGQMSFGMPGAPSATDTDSRKRKLEEPGTSGNPDNGKPFFKLPQQDGPDDAKDNDEDEDKLSNLSDSDEEDDEDIPDIVLATFERVGRTKNRWKATLKDGIAHIKGRDYVFHKGLGEMEF